jgi:GxxExxY protein
MKHGDLTSILISICIKVHEALGPGLLESVYEEVICHELAKRGIPFKRQQGITFFYEDVKMDIGFRADILVDNSVIMELKSIENIAPVHSKTVLTYLRLSGIEVGLLINFNVVLLKDGITRLIQDKR